MKKYLFAYAVLATALLFFTCRHYRAENRRLVENQTALAADVTRYRTRLGAEAASVQALRLRCGSSKRCARPTPSRSGVSASGSAGSKPPPRPVAVTDAEIRTPLRDTVVVRIHDTLPVRDTVRMFRWRDPWISVEGRIGRDSAACRIRSVDALRQAVHRIPRRFLFIRWGTKALRQEIVSTNPHTRIVYAEYVKIER
ncbi:MAG: DUF6549 family protein [Alistipes shahii]